MGTSRRVTKPSQENPDRSTSSAGTLACALCGHPAPGTPISRSAIQHRRDALSSTDSFLPVPPLQPQVRRIPFPLPRARPMKGRLRRSRTTLKREFAEKKEDRHEHAPASSPLKASAPPQVLYSYDKIEVYLWAIIRLRSVAVCGHQFVCFRAAKLQWLKRRECAKLIPKRPTSTGVAVPLARSPHRTATKRPTAVHSCPGPLKTTFRATTNLE
jgi:hypothetical protein